jgi:hypothetical protein
MLEHVEYLKTKFIIYVGSLYRLSQRKFELECQIFSKSLLCCLSVNVQEASSAKFLGHSIGKMM